MAIDYGDYAKIYGGDISAGMRGAGAGIANAIIAKKDRQKEDDTRTAQTLIDTHWDNQMSKIKNLAFGDISTLVDNPADLSSTLNAGTGYTAFAGLGATNRQHVRDVIRESGLMNATAYNQKYNEMLKSYVPMIERKLENYKKNNFKSDSDMRDLIIGSGLQRLLQEHGEDTGTMKELSYPKEGFFKGMPRRFSDSDVGPAGAALMAGSTIATGKSIAQRGLGGTGKALFSPKATGLENITSGRGFIGRGIKGSEYTKGVDKTLKNLQVRSDKRLSTAEKKLKQAQNRFAKNKGQKGLKPAKIAENFKKSTAGSKHINKVNTAKKIATKNADTASKGAWKFVQNKIKKDGLSKVLKQIAKKAGWKVAARIGAQLGGSFIAGASGIGTAIGIAGGALTAYQIYNILTSD